MEFILSAKIEVSVNGEFEEHDKLILKSPPAKEKKYPIKLRKGFMSAQGDMVKFSDRKAENRPSAEAIEAAKEKGVSPSDVEQMLFMSDINIEKYVDDFKSLMMITGVCTIGGQKLTQKHWDDIYEHDVEKLIGVYLVNFYIPLWEGKTNTSE